MENQIILKANDNYVELDNYLVTNLIKKVLLVCGSSISLMQLDCYFENLKSRTGISVIRFSNFKPNPLYESVVEGIELLHKENCDMIIAVGGGSAIDVAKCIKLFSNMDVKQNYLKQSIIPNDLKLLAVPTTAGTGSEATGYAVIYYNGQKQSVFDESCIPSAVLMDASVLKTLPIYQKKATMMDALCHAIEAFWSVNSTNESRDYSKQAIQAILANMNNYLNNEDSGNAGMLAAANMAGKAINITQTTAGHAMCYKLTSLYGIAHGHAAALCVSKLWPYMVEHIDNCIDSRGKEYLERIFGEIADAMGCNAINEAVTKFQSIYDELTLCVPKARAEDYDVLSSSVNPVRLKNNPIMLDERAINTIYHQILCTI